MKKTVLAAALAVAGMLGSADTASAACTWGGWSPYSFSMSGGFNTNFAECQTANTWAGIFKARTWMHGACALGSGCRQVSARRVSVFSPVDQCTWGGLPMPGIGLQSRAHLMNTATGTITPDVLAISQTNAACGTQYGATQAGSTWWAGVKCRIAHSC